MKKWCAFGELGFNKAGEVMETNDRYTVIKTYGKWIDYWETAYVKFFDTEEEALNEAESWNDFTDKR